MLCRRSLTFLDQSSSDDNDSVGFVVGFSILTVLSFLALIQAIYGTRHKLYGKHSLKFLLPWTALALVLENATLAAQPPYPDAWKYIMYVVQATVAPSLLLSTFDLTYLVYKTRSLPFCGLRDGQTRLGHPPTTHALKATLGLLASVLLALGVVVNFGVGFDDESTSVAGRVGWYYLIVTPSLSTQEQVQIVLALTPMAIVTLCCLHFSMALWRYGSTFSMVVHSSPLNPWGKPFFGALALGAGQWFGKKWFPMMSHVGMFIYLETVLLLLIEVNKDLKEAAELSEFLENVGHKRATRHTKKAVHHERGGGSQQQHHDEGKGVEQQSSLYGRGSQRPVDAPATWEDEKNKRHRDEGNGEDQIMSSLNGRGSQRLRNASERWEEEKREVE